MKKKIIFVLAYNEGPEWIIHYSDTFMSEFREKNFLFIIVDNGTQDNLQEWCRTHNQIYFRTENNLGSTGGYNFFIRAGEILKSRRIAVIQADVLVNHVDLFELLFFRPLHNQLIPMQCLEYDFNEFVYFPNFGKSNWNEDGLDPDVGQFFSLNPWFFIQNEYLCDENYTVTHFESTDLFLRIISPLNANPAVVINAFHKYFPGFDNTDLKLYRTTHKTNHLGMHDKWFNYNVLYWKSKWNQENQASSINELFEVFKKHQMHWSTNPWSPDENNYYKQLMLHRKPLMTERNTHVGQVPYPVEYECNRFYKEFVVTKILDREMYY